MTPVLEPQKPRPQGARKPGLQREAGTAAPVHHGFIRSFDGTRIFYSVEGSGPPLVFCYGLVCSSLHWTYQIEHFRKNYQCIWFDYRGHHNSESPTDLKSLNVEVIAKDLLCLLDELKVEKPMLLGHSMGVNIVLEFYRLFPHRVAGMVLGNGTARKPLETLFGNNLLQGAFKAFRVLYEKMPDTVRKLWKSQTRNPLARAGIAFGGFNPHLTPKADIDLYVDQVAEMDPIILLNLIENYDDYDATSWLHHIDVPTLIFGGEQDKMIPFHQQELMHQLIPGSELQLIRQGSHCPQMDLPEVINHKIEKFLALQNYGQNPAISPVSQPEQRPAPSPIPLLSGADTRASLRKDRPTSIG
ncbi:MAG: alpha/beta hydrolase [Bdellovibrionales bacterium]|nr:alpha/beta hydrolase [Bdellovibrionales bacterium]